MIKYSEKKAVTKGQILLLDQMGLLQGAFQISQLTIMGGSFIQSVGGHNILEPVFYGSPVIFGPYMHNQSEFVELVQKFSCGHQVYLHNIAKTLQSLIKVSKNDQNGQNLLKNLGGCTLKTVEFLQQL